MARSIMTLNYKGGVGKSVTTVAVGVSLARLGYEVLIVDCDPQANSSIAILGGSVDVINGKRSEDEDHIETLGEWLLDSWAVSPKSYRTRHAEVLKSIDEGHDNLFIVPSDLDDYDRLATLRGYAGVDSRLREAIRDDYLSEFDYILFDTPPYPKGTLYGRAAFVAADYALIPVEGSSADSARGMDKSIAAAGANRMKVIGVVFCRIDGRSTKANEMFRKECERPGVVHLDPEIPYLREVYYASRADCPVSLFEPEGRVAKAYLELTKNIVTEIDKLEEGN